MAEIEENLQAAGLMDCCQEASKASNANPSLLGTRELRSPVAQTRSNGPLQPHRQGEEGSLVEML